MIARRLATVVVAAAMIVGALLIRRNVIEGDEGDDDPPPPAEEASELVCLTELENVCIDLAANHPELDVTVEDARVTLDRVAGGDPVPLWLTFEPFPEMAGSPPAGDVLAASELAVAVPNGYLDVLLDRCSGQALWRCIGELTGEEWGEVPGRVEPSVGDAGRSAAALASFANAVAGYFGTVQFNNVDLQDPSFLAWVRPFVDAVPVDELSGVPPVSTMLVRPSAVNVAATSDAEIAALGAPSGELESSYPEPSMWLQAVMAAPEEADVPPDLAAEATAALRAGGWATPDPAQQPLPSANTMLALRTLWEELQ
jgi:hypothetical protein